MQEQEFCPKQNYSAFTQKLVHAILRSSRYKQERDYVTQKKKKNPDNIG